MMKKILKISAVLFMVLVACPSLHAEKKGELSKFIYFFSPSCEHCMRVKANVMPLVEKHYKDSLQVIYKDIADVENYKELFELKHKYSDDEKTVFPVMFMNGHFIDQRDIEAKGDKVIFSFIKESIETFGAEKKQAAKVDIIAYFKKIKPLAILTAGLIDGINPCSFTVIVFFLSFLSVQRYSPKTIVWAGSAFIMACFITYVAIGLGLLAPLYAFKGFRPVTQTISVIIGIISIVLGSLSLYDAFVFLKTRNPEDSLLQLPKRIKDKIHKVVGNEYRVTKNGREEQMNRSVLNIFLSALAIGFSVSILESVCTGQLYLPTIIFVLKTSPDKLRALGYLLAYNLMFILPICVIFAFALTGMTSQRFASVLKRYFFAIKIAMAALFLLLGASLVWAEEAAKDDLNKSVPAAASASATKVSHPPIVVDPNCYDFGKVNQGEVLKHTFMFKNTDPDTINIKEVNTSCACTSTKIDKKVVASGEEVPIEITFETKGYSGLKKRQLFVHTDSKKNSLTIFEIQADIQW